jgi:hypothetical protein
VAASQRRWRQRSDYNARRRAKYHAATNPSPTVIAGGGQQYLDKKWFTGLFADTIANHGEIATALDLIAAGVASKFMLDIDSRNEAHQVGVAAALCQIGKFDTTKGSDAFAYFSTVVLNSVKKHLVKQNAKRMQSLDAVVGDDDDGE